MNKFEFLSYNATPGEKTLGIAKVKIYGRIIALFKIVATKDGASFFPAAPSLKLGENYCSAFQLDSTSEKEELDNLIKSSVKIAMNGTQAIKQPEYAQTSFLDSVPF